MKKYKILNIMLFMTLSLLLIMACGDDDEVDVINSPDSYIIGTWHSFKGEAFYNGQSTIVSIEKTGAYSSSYMEFKFDKGNKMTGWWWSQDQYNLSHWTEGYGTYIIKNNIITITDTEGDSVDLLYNSKDKTLMLRSMSIVNGEYITINIYFEK